MLTGSMYSPSSKNFLAFFRHMLPNSNNYGTITIGLEFESRISYNKEPLLVYISIIGTLKLMLLSSTRSSVWPTYYPYSTFLDVSSMDSNDLSGHLNYRFFVVMGFSNLTISSMTLTWNSYWLRGFGKIIIFKYLYPLLFKICLLLLTEERLLQVLLVVIILLLEELGLLFSIDAFRVVYFTLDWKI